jgi:hypothetical protein
MNVARLNEIQAEWMALSGNAPEAEQRRVIALMGEIPRSYISIDAETGEAQPMYCGQPNSIPRPLEEVKRAHPDLAAIGVAWQCPNWIALP